MMGNNGPVRIIYTVFPEEMQGEIKGFTAADKKEYIVFIDSSRHPQTQRHTLGHELAHIYLGHFDRGGNVWKSAAGARYLQDETMEREANANAWKYYRLFLNGNLGGCSQCKK